MLFLTIITMILVVGGAVVVLLVRAAGPAEAAAARTPDPFDLATQVQALRQRLEAVPGLEAIEELRARLVVSEHEITQLRLLYVNQRTQFAKALQNSDRASVRRDSELRRDIQPARRMELVNLTGQPGGGSQLQAAAALQPSARMVELNAGVGTTPTPLRAAELGPGSSAAS